MSLATFLFLLVVLALAWAWGNLDDHGSIL